MNLAHCAAAVSPRTGVLPLGQGDCRRRHSDPLCGSGAEPRDNDSACERRSSPGPRDAVVSPMRCRIRCWMAITATVVALTGCVGDGPADPTTAREVSEPFESTTTASPIGTVDTEGDA